MTQSDTAIRPDESDEVRALRRLASLAGWCVTSTTGGKHSRTSLHYADATNGRGRAVDLADRRGPSRNSDGLLRINEDIIRLVPIPLIAELIYGGPGGICVKNGRRVDGRVTYSSVIDDHDDHVHFAVVAGFTYNGSQEVARPMPPDNDPNLPDIAGPVHLSVLCNSAGECTGYFIFSHATGELHSFGPGAKFHGRSEVVRLVAT